MYLWMKWLHVLGMVVWVGGLMGVSRLMGKAVRYEDAAARAAAYGTYKRAHMFVDWGGLGLMLISGLWLLIADPEGKGYMKHETGYFHMKLTFVLVLLVCDVLVSRRLFRAAADRPESPVFYRIVHGAAGLALMGTLVAVFVVRG